jgi:hypothetical protein
MNVSNQFLFGILIGFLLGLLFFFSLTAFSQIGMLQTQITDLQNQFNQIKNEIAQPAASPTATPRPSSSQNANVSALIGYEELQFTNVHATNTGDGAFTVYLQVKNNGTMPLTLDATKVVINGHLASIFDTGAKVTWGNVAFDTATETLNPGQSDVNANITLTTGVRPRSAIYYSGLPVEIVLQTISGQHYKEEIVLP